MDQELLVERIMQFSNNNNKELKGEATWVLTNAITQSNE